MRLILIGSEYAGKTTLAKAVSRWMIESFDLPFVRWHNHWVVPYLDRHMVVWADEARTRPGKQLDEEWDAEELDQITAMKPSLLEQLTRHMIWRHLHPDMYREPDVLLIDGYYADAVYAPIYYGFGEPGSFADRRQRARAWDRELLAAAPETVLVLVTATAETIRARMASDRHPRGLLDSDHVDEVLSRFEQEFGDSLIANRIRIDTSEVNVDECLSEFVAKVRRHLSQIDLLRMAVENRTPGHDRSLSDDARRM